MAVHARSVWDRYSARRLHDLLAGWRPARRSPAWDRQTTITAALNEVHPRPRLTRSVPVVRRRAA